jgi:hypothetical protein
MEWQKPTGHNNAPCGFNLIGHRQGQMSLKLFIQLSFDFLYRQGDGRAAVFIMLECPARFYGNPVPF